MHDKNIHELSIPMHIVLGWMNEYMIDMKFCNGICKLVSLSLEKIIYILQNIKT
jgi:hypothetical protein